MRDAIHVSPNQWPAPIEPFEFLMNKESQHDFLEALFFQQERYGKVVRLEFSPEGLRVYYEGGLIATITDALIGIHQDSAALMVSWHVMDLVGVPYELTHRIRRSCYFYTDYLVVVSRNHPRTIKDYLRRLIGREPTWSWWREK